MKHLDNIISYRQGDLRNGLMRPMRMGLLHFRLVRIRMSLIVIIRIWRTFGVLMNMIMKWLVLCSCSLIGWIMVVFIRIEALVSVASRTIN